MKHEFRLADIGEGLEEAEIIEWRVQLGGDVGDMIAVGELIAIIEDASSSDDPVPEAVPTDVSAAAAPTNSVAPDETPASPSVARPKASPATRREAARRGINLSTVTGSGPGGRILPADLDLDLASEAPFATVLAPSGTTTPGAPQAVPPAASTPPPANSTSTEPSIAPSQKPADQRSAPTTGAATRPLRGVRRRIAENMTQSWSEIPHIHAFEHIDAQPLIEVRAQLKATARSEYDHLTLLSFFVAGLASALRAFPQANASLDMATETIIEHSSVNIGIAVAAPHGLVVPVIHDADAMSFGSLCQNLHKTIAGARAGTLARDGFVGGTATITNFGSLGGEQATPLIRPPESIIVGFGSVAERPFVLDGAVVARNTMHVVIGADHRLLDGDVTTALLTHLTDRLIAPLELVLGP